MGIIWFVVCVAAVLLSMGKSIYTFALINAIANIWSFGVMHNYSHDPQNIPDFWTIVNMITTVIGVLLLIIALII